MVSENPLDGHVDGSLAVHFQLEADLVGHLFSGVSFDPIRVELCDQFEIVITQTVLVVIFECRTKEKCFFLNVLKLVYEALVDGLSFAHMFKGFNQYLVKIPVDQIVFVLKIPVESLAGHAAFFCDLFHCDLLDWSFLHAFFHCLCQSVFYFFS